MDSVHIFDYIEIDGTIYGVRADTYDQTYKVDQRWWSMMKLFKPPFFKRKSIPFYGRENKKLFSRYQKALPGKPSKNFTKDEITSIKSIFQTKGNIVVMKHVSDALHEFFKTEFGFSLNDCKEAVFEIDPETLKAVDFAKDPFINDQIYKALQEAAYGDGIDWAEEVIDLSGFEAEDVPEVKEDPVEIPEMDDEPVEEVAEEVEEHVEEPIEESVDELVQETEPVTTQIFVNSPLPSFPVIITSEDDEKVIEFMNRNNIDIPVYYNHRHPKYAEDVAKILNNTDQTYICYDTVVLDYVDIDKIYVIDDNYNLIPVKEYEPFSKKLDYMYIGEIIINFNNTSDKEKRHNIEDEEDNKVAGYDIVTAK